MMRSGYLVPYQAVYDVGAKLAARQAARERLDARKNR